MWDLIISVPDHCLTFYFLYLVVYLGESLEIIPDYLGIRIHCR